MRRAHLVSVEEMLQVEARIWVAKIPDTSIADLTFDTAPTFGLDPGDLVSDDYAKAQDFADRCRNDPTSPKVFRVPSAALPGTENIVIFGPRVMAPFNVEPISNVDVPAAVVAEDSRPLHTLPERVRYVGSAHSALAAWARGDPYELDEPDSPLYTFDH